MKKSILKKYARLIVRVGANVQKGQPVIIHGSIDQHDFIPLVAEECYKAGASAVTVEWSSQKLTLLDYKYQSLEKLSTVPEWKKAKLQNTVNELPAQIHIVSEDPAGLAGIDREKMMKARQATWPILKPYRDAMENRYQWIIAAIPSAEWAQKVFPELSRSKAIEALWKAILRTSRLSETEDPVDVWNAHNAEFSARSVWLNSHHFDAITYKSANGTNFRAELIPQGVWCGGGEETIGGVFFNPNIPTEEIFTTPMRGKAEGTLVSTKPLSYQGQIIDHFSITFHDGKAVSWNAETGEDLLGQIIQMDEGSAYLGELALVPSSSPINQSGILFYETLFDENACCHVALGAGFNDCIDGFKSKTDEECKALGVNESMVHVDFMIGAPDLCITGWNNGTATSIFENGEWAFQI